MERLSALLPEGTPPEQLARLYHTMLDALPFFITVYDVVAPATFRVVSMNRLGVDYLGVPLGSLVGKQPSEIFPPALSERVEGYLRQALLSGNTLEVEDCVELIGGPTWLNMVTHPMQDANGTMQYLMFAVQDITTTKQQAAMMQELSTPFLAISDNAVVIPLIGSLTPTRAQQLQETMLVGVSEHQATIVIVDITGVPTIDTTIANVLLRAAAAVHLLGAQFVLTGIRPDVAQTMVGLGISLGGIITHGTLQEGIRYALRSAR